MVWGVTTQFCEAVTGSQISTVIFYETYFSYNLRISFTIVLWDFFSACPRNIPEIYRICSEDIDCIGVLASYPPMCRVFASNKKSKYEVLSVPPQKSLYRGGEAGERYNCYNHLCTIYNKCENSLCVTSHDSQKYSEFFDPLTKNCSKETQ